MNLNRDKAIEAMDVLTEHGYVAQIVAIPQRHNFQVPGHDGPLYRISVEALHFEGADLRALCDLAESIGLHCRYSLQALRFEAESLRPEGIR